MAGTCQWVHWVHSHLGRSQLILGGVGPVGLIPGPIPMCWGAQVFHAWPRQGWTWGDTHWSLGWWRRPWATVRRCEVGLEVIDPALPSHVPFLVQFFKTMSPFMSPFPPPLHGRGC